MNQQKFREMLSAMPPLHHTMPGCAFDEEKSELLNWLLSRPGIKTWLFYRMTNSGRIAYNPETGCWSGVQRGPRGRPKKSVDVPSMVLDGGGQ